MSQHQQHRGTALAAAPSFSFMANSEHLAKLREGLRYGISGGRSMLMLFQTSALRT
jgi:hypothetical protein